MLPSPSHAVIGCSDVQETAAFFRLYGFQGTATGILPQEAAAVLYGLNQEAEEMLLHVPGADLGYLRLVSTPNAERHFAALDNRAFAIDLFTTDITESIAISDAAGFDSSPVATHHFGPLTIQEVEIKGPDHVVLTLLATPTRRPSILDTEPDRLHSEVHALVWSAKDLDRLLPFWVEQAGHQKLTDAVFDSPEMGAVLGVPDRQIQARLAVFADEEARPIRLELIEFVGEPAADHPNFPLAAGLHAPALQVANLEKTCKQLQGAELGEVVSLDTPLHPNARAVTAQAPGNLRFELWQEGGG